MPNQVGNSEPNGSTLQHIDGHQKMLVPCEMKTKPSSPLSTVTDKMIIKV